MKCYIAPILISLLAGAGLTYLAFATTPLRAQLLEQPTVNSSSRRFGWGRSGHHGGRGQVQGRGRHQNSLKPCPMYEGFYTQGEFETLNGRVVNSEKLGYGQGVWLDLQTDQETIAVHLGPAWYLESKEIQVSPDDELTVTGIRSAWNDETTFIPAQVEQNGKTIELRDDNGFPLWMTGRRIAEPTR